MLPASTVLHAEIEVKRSRFLARVERVDSAEAARAVIAEVRSAMPDARHHCTAFIVPDGDALPVSRSSDDGEPSGTAGRPMLDVLAGVPLVGAVAVVTRYFGGTLLGTGGLVRAYSDSVREALEGADLVRRDVLPVYRAMLPHADAGRYLAELSSLGFEAEAEYLGEGVSVSIATAQGEALSDSLARLSQGALALEAAGERATEVRCAKVCAGKAKLLAQ